ncbi:hypothetical protein A3709_00910 [Halioglobus sp. HI00S01]|uniref:hypothetical protein n=1 Tax=Halioglobus sp. HI00S01 TaxID=1822214 RepID=UPI0007C3AAC3|nr:hypothetical protein [Halioglobus sp. HI00S01]KZX60656.1 hypothetical protein A3709_00910 [Halioglobus sp. HI00S01]
MLSNKHVVIAMIVAPILAVLAWIAVGQLTGEQPRAAVEGQSYPLVEKSNCRYASGACDLENESFKLRLTIQDGASGPEFLLSASHPLEGVVLAVAATEVEGAPEAMRALDGQGLSWLMPLQRTPQPTDRIRLVARADGSSFYAEASTAFLQPAQ